MTTTTSAPRPRAASADSSLTHSATLRPSANSGTIIAQDPSLAIPDEPFTASTSWHMACRYQKSGACVYCGVRLLFASQTKSSSIAYGQKRSLSCLRRLTSGIAICCTSPCLGPSPWLSPISRQTPLLNAIAVVRPPVP